MVDVKELMIGNWVTCHFLTTRFNAQILEIRKDVVVVQDGERKCGYSYDNISHIDLSPELLEKCGFVEYKDIKNNIHAKHGAAYFIYRADIRYVLCRMWHEEPNYSMQVEYTDSPFPEDKGRNYPICFDVQYLNQLQNLIFALTGTPLTVKI